MKKPSKRFFLWISIASVCLILAGGLFLMKDRLFMGRNSVYVAMAWGSRGENISQGMENAVRMCIDKVNSEGGINGKEIKTLFFDDGNDPERAASTASAIAADEKDVLVVLGHRMSSAAIPAGKVYQRAGIPAITGTATGTRATRGKEWYFRTVSNDTFQSKYIVNYIHRSLKVKHVMIVSDKNGYSQSMRRYCMDEAKRLKMSISGDIQIDTQKNIDQYLPEISAALRRATEPTLVFLAMLESGSAKLVPALKHAGVDSLVFIADPFSRDELEIFAKSSYEKRRPGYMTNGIYTVTPVIYSIASRMTQNFRREYVKRYSVEPGWQAATTYDSVVVAMEAMRRADIQGKGYVERDRREIKRMLSDMYSEAAGVAGLQGVIYFDENGDSMSPLGVGVYHGGKLYPAMEQYQPMNEVASGESAGQSAEKVLGGDAVLHMDGRTMVKTEVVYTGIDIDEISRLNLKAGVDVEIHEPSGTEVKPVSEVEPEKKEPKGTFFAEFYLWFYFKKGFNDSSITFLKAVKPISLGEPVVKRCGDELCRTTYRVKGLFKFTPDFHDYPFDRQRLPIVYRHAELRRERLIYIEDFLSVPSSSANGDDKSNNKVAGNSIRLADDFIWYIPEQDVRLSEKQPSNGQSLSVRPQYGDKGKHIDYSEMGAAVVVKKKSWVLLHYMPVAVLFVILYTVYMFPADKIFARLLIPGSVLVTAFLFHMWLRLYLGVDYTTYIERGPYIVYAMAVLSIMVCVVAYQFLRKGRDAWARMANYAGAGIQTVVIAVNVAMTVLR